jgi:hypothetical protein
MKTHYNRKKFRLVKKPNRTLKSHIKKGGGDQEREGILDVVSEKIGNVSSNALNVAADTGLKLLGLERIEKEANKPTGNIQTGLSSTEEDSTEFLSNVKNIADKTASLALQNVNEVLSSDYVNEGITEVANDTANIVKQSAEKFNDVLNKPEVKESVKEALDNAGEIASVAVDAMKEPFEKTIDVVADATQKTTSAALSGAMKTGFDLVGAVPFWGSIIDLGRAVNDGSKAVSAMVEASSDAIETASDAFVKTKHNFEQGMRELEDKKHFNKEIMNRTSQSINEFHKSSIMKGGGVTRRKFNRKKHKSKRVRFLL